MQQRAIDIVREKIEKSRKKYKTESEQEGVDIVLKVLNSSDYVFFELSPENASKVFVMADIHGEEAKRLYKELLSPENQAIYLSIQRRKKEEEKRRIKEEKHKKKEESAKNPRKIGKIRQLFGRFTKRSEQEKEELPGNSIKEKDEDDELEL